MYSISDYLRDQAAIRDCEEHWLSDEDDYMDDYDDFDNYPYDTSEEAFD